jgi:two-component system, cell cycle response regulator CtrA
MRRQVQIEKLVVDLDNRIVKVDDMQLRLGRKEYAILELLSLHKGTTVTKEMLLEHLYGGIDLGKIRTLRVLIRNLRRKIAHATTTSSEDIIETVGGRGYRLRDLAE